MKIKIVDSAFAHANCCANGNLEIHPTYFDWYRGPEPKEICFFTDGSLLHVMNSDNSCSKNIAFLIEPPSVNPHAYEWIRHNHSFFDYVLTHNNELLSVDDKFVWFPHGGCWIEPEDYSIYQKTKNVSMIASNKKFTTGHRFRHNVISSLGDKIDFICGRGHRPIDDKLDALEDYRYSIVIENGQYETYFTEKLIDCFMTGTIPIYWGCSLKGLFDEKGILYFNSTDELEEILNKISNGEIIYDDTIHSICSNFEIAKQFTIAEDWIFKHFIKDLL